MIYAYPCPSFLISHHIQNSPFPIHITNTLSKNMDKTGRVNLFHAREKSVTQQHIQLYKNWEYCYCQIDNGQSGTHARRPIQSKSRFVRTSGATSVHTYSTRPIQLEEIFTQTAVH